jgi:hypothetical protein
MPPPHPDTSRLSDSSQLDKAVCVADPVVGDILDAAVGTHMAVVGGAAIRDGDDEADAASTTRLPVGYRMLPLVEHAQEWHPKRDLLLFRSRGRGRFGGVGLDVEGRGGVGRGWGKGGRGS